MKSRQGPRTRFIRIDFDIFEYAVRRKKAGHGTSDEKLFVHNSAKQALCILEKLFCPGTDTFLFENPRINSAQFPCVKKRRPINIRNDFGERNAFVGAHSRKRRPRRLIIRPIENRFSPARLGKRKKALRLRPTMLLSRFFLLRTVFRHEVALEVRAKQACYYPHSP